MDEAKQEDPFLDPNEGDVKEQKEVDEKRGILKKTKVEEQNEKREMTREGRGRKLIKWLDEEKRSREKEKERGNRRARGNDINIEIMEEEVRVEKNEDEREEGKENEKEEKLIKKCKVVKEGKELEKVNKNVCDIEYNESSEGEDEERESEEDLKCKFCGMERVGLWITCDRCRDWVCERCLGINKKQEVKKIFKMVKKNKGFLYGCTNCRKKMKKVVSNENLNRKAKRMIRKNRSLKLKIFELESVNESMGKMIIKGIKKIGNEEENNKILYDKNRKLRTDNERKDMDIVGLKNKVREWKEKKEDAEKELSEEINELGEKLFDEKMEALEWADNKVKIKEAEVEKLKNEKMAVIEWAENKAKSKEIEIRNLKDEIVEKTERLKEEEKIQKRKNEYYENRIKDDKELIEGLKNELIINGDDVYELKEKEKELIEEIERINGEIKIRDEEMERVKIINNSLSKINAELEQRMDIMKDILQNKEIGEDKRKNIEKKREESLSPERGRSRAIQSRSKSGVRTVNMERAVSRVRYGNEMEQQRVERFRRTQNCWKFLEGKCSYGERCMYFHPKSDKEKKPRRMLCTGWVKGECMAGSRCKYYHCDEEEDEEEKEKIDNKNAGGKNDKVGAGRGIEIKGKEETVMGRGNKGFSIMDLLGRNERKVGIGRGGYPLNREESKMGAFSIKNNNVEENVYFEKEEKEKENIKENSEEEIDFDPKLIKALAKQIKEWRD